MSLIRFSMVAILIWFPVGFGLGIAADAVGIPDTNAWLWILRLVAAAMAAAAAWAIIGAAKATTITRAVLPVLGLITNLVYLFCFVMAVAAVVTIFSKDATWVYQRLYRPYISPLLALAFFSLVPIALLLLVFGKTRVLGGISLYLLSMLFGFTLWFYSLMIAGSHGPGWVIGGLLMMGLGVILTAVLSSAIWGEWGVAGALVLATAVTTGAYLFGVLITEKQVSNELGKEGGEVPDSQS